MISGPSELRDYDLKDIYNEYHWRVYHEDPQWWNTTWRGVKCQKLPSDLIILAEIIHKIKPDVIIETGCAYGGSTLFLRDMARMYKPQSTVYTLDLKIPDAVKGATGILPFEGSSVELLSKIKVASTDTVMVDLDSDHSKEHVLQEMKLFGPLVTKGSYMLVEDTNINGNPVFSDYGPGPMEAVEEFLQYSSQFVVDTSCEKYGVTFHPKGWLKRN